MKKYLKTLSFVFMLTLFSVICVGCSTFDCMMSVSVTTSSITFMKDISSPAILTHSKMPIETFMFAKAYFNVSCDKSSYETSFNGIITNAKVVEVYNSNRELVSGIDITENEVGDNTVVTIPSINHTLEEGDSEITYYFKIYVNNPCQVDFYFYLGGDQWTSPPETAKTMHFVNSTNMEAQKIQSPNLKRSYIDFTWDAVTHATNYSVLIKDSSSNVIFNNLSYVDKIYTAHSLTPNVTYTISVTANGDGLFFESSNPTELTFTILNNLQVTVDKNNRRLTWEAVEGANQYVVILNTLKFTITGQNYFDISNISTKSNTILLYAINDTDSATSKPYENNNLKVLQRPVITKPNDFKIEWINISSNISYEIYINGELKDVVTDVIAYQLPSGINKVVKIRAVSNDPNILPSTFSNEITYTLG